MKNRKTPENSTEKKLKMPDWKLNLVIYTPSKLKQKFEDYDMEYKNYIPAAVCTIAMLFGLICSLALSLKLPYIIAIEVIALLYSPLILVAILDEKNEKRRFEDLNSYLQQFIGGMILHKRVITALKDTSTTFTKGQMHRTLQTMLAAIEHADPKIGLKTAERQSFMYMENQYQNNQSGMIHDFALRVESRGGEFEEEMKMLDSKREKWEKRTEHCQNQMRLTMFASMILYAAIIFICVMVQRMIPEYISIMDITLSQISETLFIIFFYHFALMAFKRMSKGWLINEHTMSDKEAKETLDFLDFYDKKKERKKGIICGSIFLLFTAGIYVLTRNIYITSFGALITIAGYNLHNIYKLMVLHKVKKDMRIAVPKWLFDVCLLMQKNNITVSITESLRTAPPILKREIQIFLNKLKKNPSSVEPYLEFLEQYNVPNVRSTMRMLISIQNGSTGDMRIQMTQLSEHNMNMLDEIDAMEMEVRNAATSRYSFYPIIPSVVVLIGYLVSIVLKVFEVMNGML